jgi:signal transduction histidine kinase/ligand-binding sensor domain-containing protein
MFCAVSSAPAQYHFDSYTTDSGLPQNSIWAMCQTRDGYIWLATGEGLLRFDGVRFEVFNSINTPALKVNGFSPSGLLEDAQGALWAGTWAGGAIRYHSGIFTEYTTKDGLPDDRVVRIDEDEEGSIWIFTYPGLARWKNGRLVRVAPQPGSPFDHFLVPPRNLGDDAPFAGLWRLNSGGWERFAYGRWSSVPLPPGIADPAKVRFSSIIEDSGHRLWYRLAGRDGEYYCVTNGHLTVFKGLPHNAIVSYQDPQGFLWTTDPHRHAALWKNGQLTPLANLSTPSPFRVLMDREGGVWVGTSNEGLYHLRRQAITVYHSPGPEDTNDIHALLLDQAGNIWFGSNAGLGRFRDGRFETFREPDVGPVPANPCLWCTGSRHRVLALNEDRDGAIWVGTGNGIERFRDGRLHWEKSLSAQIRNPVNVIYRDRTGNLWFGGDGGLYRLNNGKLAHYTNADGLGGDSVTTMLEDQAGRLWIGTEEGLARFSKGVLSSWTEANGWSSAEVASLYEDDAGVLWIGSFDKGLSRLEGGKVTRITTAQGLYSNNIFGIIEDNQGFLWMASRLGLFRVRKQELNDLAAGRVSYVTSTHFGKADGLVNLDCTSYGQPAGFKARDGKLWFRTQGGIGSIDPKLVPLSDHPPAVMIESCILGHNPVGCGGGLTIHPSQQDVEILYTGLSFIRPDDMRFKYRQEGLDREWVESGTRRIAYYSHLPPGHYVFRVIAANSDGVWNAEGKSLPVVVLPPLYRTWWFLSMALASTLGLVCLAWQYRVAQLKRAHGVQQAFSRQLIASQESERKRIAAELHDSLGQRLVVIRNLALISLNDATSNGTSSPRMSEISAEASQALSEVREISYNLRPYQLDRIGLTKAIEAIIKKASGATAITFTAEIEEIDNVLPRDLEINFYRIVQECVNNVVKHSQATAASVGVRCTPGGLMLTVRDNGKGFTPGASDSSRAPAGFGLIGIFERAQLLGGKPVIQSAPGEGTTVSIEIPLGHNRNGQ